MPKNFVFSADVRDKPPDGGGGPYSFAPPHKTSFRDMVMGKQEVPPPREKVDLLKDELALITFQDNDPLLPMVHINESVFEGLCAPWKNALVVKLLGKSIGYRTMRDKLERTWKLLAGFEIMDIGNGFYMVKFKNDEDHSKVMFAITLRYRVGLQRSHILPRLLTSP